MFSANIKRSQRIHTHYIALGLAAYLAHGDLYVPVKGDIGFSASVSYSSFVKMYCIVCC